MHLMLSTALLAAAVGAGTYQTQATTVRIEGHGRPAQCYRLDPDAAFTVDGPARLRLRFWVDLPPRHHRARPVRLAINVDDHIRHHRLRVRPERRLHYAPRQDQRPSRPLRPIPVRIRAGQHHLIVTLPHRHSGCVELLGVRHVQPAPAAPGPVAQAPVPAPVPAPAAGASESAPPPPATPPAPKAASTGAGAAGSTATAAATNPNVSPGPKPPQKAGSGAAQPTLAAVPKSNNATGGTTVEEIHAYGVGQQQPGVTKSAAASPAPSTASARVLRVGPQVGGLLPRGNLQPSMSVSLLLDVPLALVGMPADLHLGGVGVAASIYATGGWTPFRQQDNVMIQGPGSKQTGSTKLIQNTTDIPFELGLRTTFDLHAFIDPYINVGLAMDVVQTSLRIFSLAPQHHDHFELGVAVGVGGLIPAGPGDVTVEVRYREVGTKLGSLSKVAETALGNASLQLGYVFAIPI